MTADLSHSGSSYTDTAINWRRLVYCDKHKRPEPVATVLESHKRRLDFDAYDVKAVLTCGAPVHIIASAANLEAMKG